MHAPSFGSISFIFMQFSLFLYKVFSVFGPDLEAGVPALYLGNPGSATAKNKRITIDSSLEY